MLLCISLFARPFVYDLVRLRSECSKTNNLKTFEVPWQMVKPLLNEKSFIARQKNAEASRTAIKGVFDLDHYLLRNTLRQFHGEEESILKSVVTLATADDHNKV